MKRLLCIVSAMNAGGAETFMMKLYRRLDREKYQIDFCVNTREEGLYDAEIKALGGRIFFIPAKTADFRAYKAALSRLIRTQQYRYVLRITSNCAGFLDLKIAKKAGCAVCAARSSNSSDGERVVLKVLNTVCRALFSKYVDIKIAPSDLAAVYTFGKKATDAGNVYYLHNALDLAQFCYSESLRKTVRQELSLENKVVFGHIGRFSRQKNHTFLLDVFACIRKKAPDAVLLLVGVGELEDEIHRLVREKGLEEDVIFTGLRTDIPAVLSAMDVFVFPSFYEGMPNTVLEAQATGLGCVISDTITREADITGRVCYLPLTESPDIWADTAIRLAQTPRPNTHDAFVRHGYDIDSAVNVFTQMIFENQSK